MNSRFAGDHPGIPDLRAVVHHLERVVGDVENDVGITERGRAELARQPAPAFHIDDHGIDLAVALRAVERPDGAIVQNAGGFEFGSFLEFTDRLRDPGVVMGAVGIFRNAELGPHLRHTRIFYRGHTLFLAARRYEIERRTFRDLNDRSTSLTAQLGQLHL